jgi:crotonobetainyl-CoA:carnitine CoA-transferase CaiB-like acyl-CoA transferase
LISAHLANRDLVVRRGGENGANAFLAAPYGVYPTSDGYLSIAMNPVPLIGSLIGLDALAQFADPQSWWARRDEIERLIAAHLRQHPTQHWLDLLQPADVWCAPVLTLPDLVASEGFAALDMVQETRRPSSTPEALSDEQVSLSTTRSPLRIDGAVLKDDTGAPTLGAHTQAIRVEFGLDAEQPDTEQPDTAQPDTAQP